MAKEYFLLKNDRGARISSKAGRHSYFLEFYDNKDNEPELISRIMRRNALDSLQAQLLYYMQQDGSFILEEEDVFIENLLSAMRRINSFTGKMIFKRKIKRNGELYRYWEQAAEITTTDKRKVDEKLKVLIKNEMLRKLLENRK